MKNLANNFCLLLALVLIYSCEDKEEVQPVPPVASFYLSVDNPEVGNSVQVLNTSTDAESYEWEITYPDGGSDTRTDEEISVFSTVPGTMVIVLKAINAGGSDSKSLVIEWIESSGSDPDPDPDPGSGSGTDYYIDVQTPPTWEAGTTQSINWTDNISENVVIFLIKGSTTQGTIVSSTASDGSYSFTMPSTMEAGTDYWIWIQSVNDDEIYGVSDYFTITNQSGGGGGGGSTSTSVEVSNALFSDISVYHNDSYLGEVGSRSTKSFEIDPSSGTNTVSWEIEAPYASDCGIYLGQSNVGGVFEETDPTGTWGINVDNEVGSTTYFGLFMSNQTSINVHWDVNYENSDSWDSDNCTVIAGSEDVYLGYYRYRSGFTYDVIVDKTDPIEGSYSYWDINSSSITTGSGYFGARLSSSGSLTAPGNEEDMRFYGTLSGKMIEISNLPEFDPSKYDVVSLKDVDKIELAY